MSTVTSGLVLPARTGRGGRGGGGPGAGGWRYSEIGDTLSRILVFQRHVAVSGRPGASPPPPLLQAGLIRETGTWAERPPWPRVQQAGPQGLAVKADIVPLPGPAGPPWDHQGRSGRPGGSRPAGGRGGQGPPKGLLRGLCRVWATVCDGKWGATACTSGASASPVTRARWGSRLSVLGPGGAPGEASHHHPTEPSPGEPQIQAHSKRTTRNPGAREDNRVRGAGPWAAQGGGCGGQPHAPLQPRRHVGTQGGSRWHPELLLPPEPGARPTRRPAGPSAAGAAKPGADWGAMTAIFLSSTTSQARSTPHPTLMPRSCINTTRGSRETRPRFADDQTEA